LTNLGWNGQGKALDIGCGNGALTIKMAKKYPKSEVEELIFGVKDGNIRRILAKKTLKSKVYIIV
jgi:16S rRNA G1207 methylase RsmC